jgi:hypothetical protein
MNRTGTDALNAAIGTSVAEFLTLPICTLKTNFQNGNVKSIPTLAKSIYREQGLRAFYRASFPAIGGQIVSTTSKWTLYNAFKQRFHPFKDKTNANNVFNGAASGMVTSFFTHPIEVMKVHWQMGKSFPGLRYMYRGYSKSFMKLLVGNSLFFPLNDACRSYYSQYRTLSETQRTIASSLTSAVVSTTIIHPVDYMRTRQMYNQSILHGWNPVRYYKGYTLNLMRVVPHFTILMTIINWLDNRFL